MQTREKGSQEAEISYSVLVVMGLAIVLFVIANAFEPQVDSQLDFFELIYLISSAAPVVFCFVIAKRYWGSRVFGKAYLALGIAFLMGHIGDELFQYYQLSGISNPYPYYPDIFFSAFFPFAFYHLYRNIRLFKSRFEKADKLLLVMLPAGVTLVYTVTLLMPASVPGGVPDMMSETITLDGNTFKLIPVSEINSEYVSFEQITVEGTTYYLVPLHVVLEQTRLANGTLNLVPVVISNSVFDASAAQYITLSSGFYMGIYYSFTATMILSLTAVGLRTFRGTVLGSPWGLLVVGIGLGTLANVIYSYTSIFFYDRTSPILGLWVLGNWIVCYALYLHRRQL